ncbi:MAG: YraN family protein [Cyanobacteria bacterium]|nr:YraN family protein [Cyanobacteriota bacterium]
MDYVISKGYLVVETNWRSGRTGEIDMILKSPEKDLVVFVEVKTRRSTGHGAPIESVSLEKQSRMISLSEQYVQANPVAQKAQRRFDIIGVLMPGAEAEAAQVIHLENAFP